MSIVVAFGAVASSASAQTIVAELSRPAPVAAHGNVLAWSEWRPAERRYRLMVREAGVVRQSRVAGRRAPFDVDVGPDRDGRPAVVYSRCRVDIPDPRTSHGLGCDIFKLRLADDHEQRVTLRGINRRDTSETRPALWRSTLAFVRVFERRPGLRGVLPHVLVRTGDGRLRELGAGPRGEYPALRYRGGRRPTPPTPRYALPEGPDTLDIDRTRVAFDWNATVRSCPEPQGPVDGDRVVSQILSAQYRESRRSRVVDRGCTANTVTGTSSPSLGRHGPLLYLGSLVVPTDHGELRLIGPPVAVPDTTGIASDTGLGDDALFWLARLPPYDGRSVIYEQPISAFTASGTAFVPDAAPSAAPPEAVRP